MFELFEMPEIQREGDETFMFLHVTDVLDGNEWLCSYVTDFGPVIGKGWSPRMARNNARNKAQRLEEEMVRKHSAA